MKIIEQMLASLPLEPRVEALWVGAFDTVVRSQRWGISTTFRDPCSGRAPAWVRGAGTWVGKSAAELAELSRSSRLLEASVGLAALNSLLPLDGLEFQDENAARIVARVGKGRRVTIVGDFPFLTRLESEFRSLDVVEALPWEGEQGLLQAARVLPAAEVVALTASSFINGTAQRLLELCSPGAYTVVLGPTAPFSPVLFEYGVDAVCGTLFVSPERALPFIREGAPFRQIEGLRRAVLYRGDA